jgi:hypothetical protein
MARVRLLEDTRAGTTTLRDALDHPAAQNDLAFRFLAAAAYSRNYASHIRERSALLAFRRLNIAAHYYVHELSPKQRDDLAAGVRHSGRGRRRRPTRRAPSGIKSSAAREPTGNGRRIDGKPLAAQLDRIAATRGLLLGDASVWAGVDQVTISLWRRGGLATLHTVDRVLCTTDLLWWDVWPPDEYPEALGIFDPQEAAA